MRKNKEPPSRKWRLTLLILVLATVGAFVPPLLSAWLFGAVKPLVILSGAEWVSVVSLVAGAYCSTNVWQKHVEKGVVPTQKVVDLMEESAVGHVDDSEDKGKEA